MDHESMENEQLVPTQELQETEETMEEMTGTEQIDVLNEEPKVRENKLRKVWDEKAKPAIMGVITKVKDYVQVLIRKLQGLESKKVKLILGGTGGAVALLLLVMILSVTVFQTPEAKVGVALGNTVDEFSQIYDLWKLPKLAELAAKKSSSLDFDVSVHEIGEEKATLSGAGVRFMMDTNLKQRKLGMQVIPYVGSADLMTVMLAAKDEVVYFYSPELMPDIYGINTVTLMEDLKALGADPGDAEDISFNVFDILEMAGNVNANREENQETLQAALQDLLESVLVEQGKKQTIRVNGASMKCDVYTAEIPQNALETYVEMLEEILSDADYQDLLEDILDSMNMPRSITREIMNEVDFAQVDFDVIYDLLDELDDVELKLYIKDKRIVAVKYDEEVYGDDWEVELHIGGAKQYIDNITLKIDDGYNEVVIKSSGDHKAKGGTFTDKTTVEFDGNKIAIQTKYSPKSNADNLSVTLRADQDEVRVKGTYLVNGNAFQMDLAQISYEHRDEELFDISVNVHLGRYTERTNVADAVLLADMTEEDLEKIVEDVEEMSTAWAMSLLEENPELAEFF